ncbi:MAG: triose-phosphate isomerase, partial [Gemmatimonadetes bacterium]|nr:triose-phosphate isomerase [Gemmatimonadota bacterium]
MRKVVAGNWTMHHGPAAAAGSLSRFRPRGVSETVELILFPPDLSLRAVSTAARVPVGLGVQNIHWEESGARTGEISAEMAREAGASFALIG